MTDIYVTQNRFGGGIIYGTIDWYRVKAVTFKDDGTPRVELEPLDNE